MENEPIGRVAVNLKNLKRDTVYTLRYNLYPSSNVTARNAQGAITIRLRIEINDEKAALLASLRPRPIMHINVTKEKSFRVARYTCYGEVGSLAAPDSVITTSVFLSTFSLFFHLVLH